MEFIYKNCVFILTCLNFSHLQVPPIWCNKPIGTFFPLFKNSFLNTLIFMPFIAYTIFILRFYFFIFRERGMEGARKGEKHRCARETSISCLSHAPNWRPGLQPRHVPWLGIKQAISQFAGWHSIHWATPPRALLPLFVSPLPLRQSVSLWGFFPPGKTTKKVTWGEIGWIVRMGHREHVAFV